MAAPLPKELQCFQGPDTSEEDDQILMADSVASGFNHYFTSIWVLILLSKTPNGVTFLKNVASILLCINFYLLFAHKGNREGIHIKYLT